MKNSARLFLFFLIGIVLTVIPVLNSIAQNPDTNGSGAVIESDSIKISAIGNKASMIRIAFKRNMKVQIHSEEGVEAFNNICLPESFDPILKIHSPEARNTGKYMTNISINAFNVKIHKPDGTVLSPELMPQLILFKSVDILEDRFGEYQKYEYMISDLEPGDVLEYQYDYSVLYSENVFSLLTFRIFFHGNFPVLQKHFTFIKGKSLDAEITSIFCDALNDASKKGTAYSLHFENLEGCMNESGIRPYNSLPHIVISLRPDEFVYTIPNSFSEAYIPFYVFGPAIREDRHLTIVKAMSNGVNSKQYNEIRRFIAARLENTPEDNTGYTQLYAVHNYIAENFEFDTDLEYFDRLDTRDENFGDYTAEGVIRDRSRYNVYVALIAGLELNYFTAYLADKRSGIISDYYFEPTISNDNLFAVMLKTDVIQFIYPKKERFGYYLNELPFYFEDAKVRLIYLDDFRNYKKAIEDKFVSITTPASTHQDNLRKQSASVNIDLENMTAEFDASISLSGQFSTLGRGAYLYNNCDPTVDPRYCMKFWESISPNISPEDYKMENLKQDFPFKATISTTFSTDEVLSKSNDTIYLNLKGWFNHIVDNNLNADSRVLTYYPDFKYTDAYTYLLTFSRNVKIIDRLPIKEINNAYGSLLLKCIQKMDGTLLLSSRVIVKADKVTPDKISMVKEIQDQLKKLNQLTVRMIELE